MRQDWHLQSFRWHNKSKGNKIIINNDFIRFLRNSLLKLEVKKVRDIIINNSEVSNFKLKGVKNIRKRNKNNKNYA